MTSSFRGPSATSFASVLPIAHCVAKRDRKAGAAPLREHRARLFGNRIPQKSRLPRVDQGRIADEASVLRSSSRTLRKIAQSPRVALGFGALDSS